MYFRLAIGSLLFFATGCAGASIKNNDRSDALVSYVISSGLVDVKSSSDFAYRLIPPAKAAPAMAVVYLTNRSWCGTGGCHLLILSLEHGKYKILKNIPAIQTPVTILGRVADGYPIFGVEIRGGGIKEYRAALRPKNGVYPETINGAVPIRSSSPTGRMLISSRMAQCKFSHGTSTC